MRRVFLTFEKNGGIFLKTYSDPTAAQATGKVYREWIRMAILAIRIRRSNDRKWADEQAKRFTGIFSRLLTDPEEEVVLEIPSKFRKNLPVQDNRGARAG